MKRWSDKKYKRKLKIDSSLLNFTNFVVKSDDVTKSNTIMTWDFVTSAKFRPVYCFRQ